MKRLLKELLKTAEEIANLYKNGQELGLQEELLYDALQKPAYHIFTRMMNWLLWQESLRKCFSVRIVLSIGRRKKLLERKMRKMASDLQIWHPPEDYDFAINTVISQCELDG